MGHLLPRDGTISIDPSISALVVAAAIRAGAVADVCTVPITADGGKIDTDKVGWVGVGPTYEGFLEMSRDPKRHLIVATGGDIRRIVPVRAVLRGGLLTDLLTDTVTARFILEQDPDREK